MSLPAFVGRYKIHHEIARGGFAIVAKAWDEELESFVALKILLDEFVQDEEIKRRFLQEARLLRRIHAPNVITVHDVGRLGDGRPYFVMDFADRGTLTPRLADLDRGPANRPHDLLPLIDALADGLNAIHATGLVHRDIKPDNILFQSTHRTEATHRPPQRNPAMGPITLIGADERIFVGDLGIAKDMIHNSAYPTMLGGTPLYLAPEQNTPSAKVSLAADVYSATALVWHALTGSLPPTPEQLATRITALSPAWQAVIEQGMAIDPAIRFMNMDVWRSALYEALGKGVVTDPGANAAAEVCETEAACPYKGLAAYQLDDARYFCGREALIDELIRRVQLHQVLVVGGPSGSGKSSLVRAGLLPALEAGALPGSETWQLVLMTPGRSPLAELHARLTTDAPLGSPSATPEELLENPSLITDFMQAGGLTRRIALIFIDQFEELFTLVAEAERAALFTLLAALTDPARSQVKVVIAVRADFYGACAQVPWLAGRITNNQVLVGPMTRIELRRAITEPARRAGLYLERGLVEAIVEEAGTEAGSLPLVAHALVETWVRRKGNTLTLEGFQDAGGVAGAISQTADATFAHRLDDAGREVTKRLFLRLVSPGDVAPDTRRMLPRSEIALDEDADIMNWVVEKLTEARLLTIDDGKVQIAHEALLHSWPRLHRWIEESRDDLRMRQKISRAAAGWDTEARDADLLYRGTPLLAALEWTSNNPNQLGRLEREFLHAAVAAKHQQEALAAARLKRSRRIRGLAVAALSLLAVGATLSTVIAYHSFREAQRNEERAANASIEAKERFAAALGSAAFGHVKEDPRLALALAAEAIARGEHRAPSYDTRAAMISARKALAQGRAFLLGSPMAAGDALAIRLSPDGGLLAIAQNGGSIDLIDPQSRTKALPSLTGHRGGVRAVSFGPVGRQLAAGGTAGTVRLWPLPAGGGGAPRVLGKTADVVVDVCFHPNGRVVASANGDGTIRLWDTMGRGQLGAPLAASAFGFNAVEISPDGGALVASSSDAHIHGWLLPSRAPAFESIVETRSSHLLRLEFNAHSDLFAAVSTDGSATLIQYPQGEVLGRAFDAGTLIGAAVFDPTGNLLIGGDADGQLRLWDIAQRRELQVTPSGHSQPIIDASLSDDGMLLATLGRDQSIRFWSLGTDYPLAVEYNVSDAKARAVAFSADGRYLAAGDDAGEVRVWDLENDADPIQLPDHPAGVWGLTFAPDGTLIASGDRKGHIRLSRPSDGALVREWRAPGAVWSLSFDREGHRVLGASDSSLDLWDVATGNRRHSFPQVGGMISRMAVGPRGDLVAVSSSDGRIRVFDMALAVQVQEIAADDDIVWSLAFAPDGQRLATASGDEVVAVWNLASGEREALFTGHSGGATDVAFLADGITLVVTDRDGGLHWWDLRTQRKLAAPWQAHRGASWRIALHPGGATFATSGDDGAIRIWDALQLERACDLGRPTFDAGRRKQYLGSVGDALACDAATASHAATTATHQSQR